MKKLLATILAAVMLAGSLSATVSAELYLYQDYVKDDPVTLGNIDGEGNINAKDSNLLKSYIAGREGAAEAIDINAADLNSDKKINTKDTYLLKSIIVGRITNDSLGEGKATYMLTIGGVDVSEFTIYAPEPEGSDNNATYAAELMKKYVRVATGIDLQIKTGTPEGHAIIFNKIERDTELGQKLGTENYQYTVEGGNLNIYGTYRGNMYAVYEILETYLGYRFFDSDYTYLYKNGIVDIPDGTDRFFAPLMKYRFCGGHVTGDNAQVYYFPSRLNSTQTNGFSEERYGTKYGAQFIHAHSYGYYWRMSLGEMPEEGDGKTLNDRYIAKLADGQAKWDAAGLDEYNWQPCASDEEVYNKLFDGMIDTIRMIEEAWGSPTYAFTTTAKKYVEDGQKSMSFSLCDNEKYCTCKPCRTRIAKEGASGTYLDMSNKAAKDLQTYNGGIYAGMRIHSILYNHKIPQTVRPDKNVIVYYCGHGCNNHIMGSGECGTCKGQLGKENNVETDASLKAWGQFCKESGAEMWFWYYGVTYHYVLVGMPNILNLYYDIKYLYEECNCQGVYYEGGGRDYNFGKLKEYLAIKMMWEPNMSYERFTEHMKEYLHMSYGDGVEELYEFILMQNQAGDECGTCFISNFDRPGDMYSYKYIRDHYEEMRQLLVDALGKATRPEQVKRLETMISCFDFLGLSCSYFDMYRDGTAESRALYEQRYTEMLSYMKTNKIIAFSEGEYFIPDEVYFDLCPIVQVYGEIKRNDDGSLASAKSDASRRADVNNFFLTGVES